MAQPAIRWRRCDDRSRGAISVYARHRDYHEVIKGRLKMLAGWLVAAARPERVDVKVFVDTAPVMEKPLAAAAGIGWQGKHTNLVSAASSAPGCFSARFSPTSRLPPTRRSATIAARCRACLDACPTQAFAGALSARCAPLRLLSDDRAQGADRAGTSRRDRQPHLRLRRLPRGLPLEQVRAGGPRGQAARRAEDFAAPPLAELAALDEDGFRAPLRRRADQTDRPRALSAQRHDRDRQFGGRARSRPWRAAAPAPSRRRWCARWRSGRCRVSRPPRNFALSRAITRARKPT